MLTQPSKICITGTVCVDWQWLTSYFNISPICMYVMCILRIVTKNVEEVFFSNNTKYAHLVGACINLNKTHFFDWKLFSIKYGKKSSVVFTYFIFSDFFSRNHAISTHIPLSIISVKITKHNEWAPKRKKIFLNEICLERVEFSLLCCVRHLCRADFILSLYSSL